MIEVGGGLVAQERRLLQDAGRLPGSEDAENRPRLVRRLDLGREMIHPGAEREPARRLVRGIGADHRVRQPVRHQVLTLRAGAEPEEVLLGEVVAAAVQIDQQPLAGQARHGQPPLDHPVFLQRDGGEGAEVGVAAEQPDMAIAGADREPAARGDVADLRIDPLGRVEQPLEEAAGLEVEQQPLEARPFRRLERLRLLLPFEAQRLGAAGWILGQGRRRQRRHGQCRQQDRQDRQAPHAARSAGSSAVSRRCSRAMPTASTSQIAMNTTFRMA